MIIIVKANKGKGFLKSSGSIFNSDMKGMWGFPNNKMSCSDAGLNRSFVSRFDSNINQICRRINSTGHFYDADVAELKERMADVWELLKVQQREEL